MLVVKCRTEETKLCIWPQFTRTYTYEFGNPPGERRKHAVNGQCCLLVTGSCVTEVLLPTPRYSDRFLTLCVAGSEEGGEVHVCGSLRGPMAQP